MTLTRVFGSSDDPERRLKAIAVIALTAAIGVLLLLALFLYMVFSEVVDNKARSAALENSNTLANSSTSLTERINHVSSDVDALNGRSAVLDQRIEDVEGKAASLTERINRVSDEVDSLNTTSKVLERQIRDADGAARSASVDAGTAVSTLSTSLTGLTEQARLVTHDIDGLRFDSTRLEDRLRDVQREIDALNSDFRDLKQRFDQKR